MRLALDRPGAPAIDSYGGGIFRCGREAWRGSILLLPDGVRPWRVAHVHQISFEVLRPLCRMAGVLDVLLLGTGTGETRPPAPVVEALERAGLRVDVMPTAPACRTWNALVAEDRAVGAALIAVH